MRDIVMMYSWPYWHDIFAIYTLSLYALLIGLSGYKENGMKQMCSLALYYYAADWIIRHCGNLQAWSIEEYAFTFIFVIVNFKTDIYKFNNEKREIKLDLLSILVSLLFIISYLLGYTIAMRGMPSLIAFASVTMSFVIGLFLQWKPERKDALSDSEIADAGVLSDNSRNSTRS